MRISDWSSDVCSSDLNGRRFAAVCPTKEGHAVPDAAAPLETLDDLVRAVDRCTRCPLYRHATQGVAGEGPASARIMLVGEQPGDQEDVQGRPFVGPAGRLLDEAIDRQSDVQGTSWAGRVDIRCRRINKKKKQ